MKLTPLLTVAAIAGAGVAAAPTPATAQAQTAIASTAFRRSPNKDFVPERSFIVNKGPQLHSYQLRFKFDPPAPKPIDFQSYACAAKTASGQNFSFVFRDQSIPANRADSDVYFLIVPIADVSAVACAIGTKPPQPGNFATTRAPAGGTGAPSRP